ncbi:hypothetical protein [Paraburkholderia sp. BL10I2N1]|uniref:hypothetical protein n=1 Tax=Paraburkholderia sp. BL10I2N1 TaxID=1938796 RepID=UPI00105FE78D|nr:hypothetical protein [Paraburkholderia sp. BL10I2N1]TDN67060.1 hypothetical protein B0G77_0281 [Paraburkholderia sp. BL10I2N1]
MRTAPNFNVPPGVNISGYPAPRIDHVTHRRITVDTSFGPRQATEVTIHGAHFAIRAVSPEVRVNGLELVSFRIDNNTKSITGYLFEDLHAIHHVLIDYGLGARGEWWPHGGAAPGKRLRFALIGLLIVILLALVFLALRIVPLAWAGMIVAAAIAVFLVWTYRI